MAFRLNCICFLFLFLLTAFFEPPFLVVLSDIAVVDVDGNVNTDNTNIESSEPPPIATGGVAQLQEDGEKQPSEIEYKYEWQPPASPPVVSSDNVPSDIPPDTQAVPDQIPPTSNESEDAVTPPPRPDRAERDRELEQMADVIRSEDPYRVLSVDKTATQAEIRKAFRKLSMQFHPDRHEGSDVAARIFQEIGAAYELLGDPDKRAAFDDFGKDKMEGFHSYWEYMQSNRPSTRDFYQGNNLITTLTEQLWDRRVTGQSMWVVNFYAPWCTHCAQMTGIWSGAASALEGEVEFGCVNGVKEQQLLQRFGVREYPTIIFFAPSHGIHRLYPAGQHRTQDSILEWIKKTQQEVRWLMTNSALFYLTPENFTEKVIENENFWVVLYSPGLSCGDCQSAHTNAMRLSAGLRGIANVGVVDCYPKESNHQGLCGEQAMLPLDHPQIKLYAKGKFKGLGERLMMEGLALHSALQLLEKIVRMTLGDQVGSDALQKGGEKPDYEETKKDEPPPPPPPAYSGPSQQHHYVFIGGGARPNPMIGGG